jgi:HK97 family phage prohead protease
MTDFSARAEKRHTTERRAVAREFELRASDDGSGGTTLTFTGYASVTESPYEMEDWLGPYTEVIRRGAFGKTLAEAADVPFKLNHDGMTLARTKSGTMSLSEDETGLHVEAQLDPRNSAVRDIQSAMERGDMDEMSFGFRVIRQEWSPDYTQRDISEVSLNKGDVSLVNYGANPHTGGLTSLRGRDVADAVAEWKRTADPADVERLARSLADEAGADDELAVYLAEQAAKRAATRRV